MYIFVEMEIFMKTRRILSLLLAFVMLFGCSVSYVSAADSLPFEDVPESAWHRPYVEYVYGHGLMQGVSSTEFAPDSPVSRAMFVTILGRLYGAEPNNNHGFSDVEAGSWYEGYVGWAAKSGMVSGFPDGTFKPNEPINREQMSKVVSLYIDYIGMFPTVDFTAANSFADAEKISSWAKGFTDDMRRSGLLKGNENGEFQPSGTLTRAQAATLIMRLREMTLELRVEEPVVPSYIVEGEDFNLLGAWDIYYAAPAITSSYNGISVNTSGSLPYIEKDDDGRLLRVKVTIGAPNIKGLVKLNNPAGHDNYIGIDTKILALDSAKYPVVRIGYRTAESTDVELGIGDTTAFSRFDEPIEAKAESVSDGWSYTVKDLTPILNTDAEMEMMTLSSASELELLYFAMFKTVDEAEAFDVTSYSDRLKVYSGEKADYVKLDSAAETSFNKEIDERIDYINNLPDLDPTLATGKVYYISSANGNDSNDGLSPDKAWRTLSNLEKSVANDSLIISAVEKGSTVLFERGSVFGRSHETNNSGGHALIGYSDIIYGAYGEGDKPVFTMAHDTAASMDWVESDKGENIWCLRNNLPNKDGVPSYYDIGSIAINGGSLWGIKILPTKPLEMWSSGSVTEELGFVTNGEETFHTEQRELTSVGNVLKNNLEFLQDYTNGALYMYCDKGNPGEIYEDITISLLGDGISIGSENTTIHNLAVKHVGSFGVSGDSAANVKLVGVEFEWIGGSLQGSDDCTRFGNAYQNWGDCDGVLVKDCYVDQVYDAGFTTQGSGKMVNFTVEGCVIENTMMGIEMFNQVSEYDPEPEFNNLFFKGNYFRDGGYGFGNQRPQADKRCGFFYGSMNKNTPLNRNYVFEDNLFLYTSFYAMKDVDFARGDHADGIVLRGNTYVAGCDTKYIIGTSSNIINMSGHAKSYYPYTEQFITYLKSIGIERGGKFYYYEGERTDAERDGAYIYPLA